MSAVRQTSRTAYAEHERTGKAGSQRARILAHIASKGPLTRQEVSHETGVAINAVCGRVKELLDAGLLVEPRKRVCSVSGKQAGEVSVPEQPSTNTAQITARKLRWRKTGKYTAESDRGNYTITMHNGCSGPDFSVWIPSKKRGQNYEVIAYCKTKQEAADAANKHFNEQQEQQ